jgi:S-adenosylmethionine-diacylgycerolhomoserine-N-methlytransferase
VIADARVLIRLLRGQSRSGTHAERLQAFYGPQADRYDRFREHLLHGRRTLIERLAPGPAATVVELGGGTGRNLLFFGRDLERLQSVTLVDLCPAMLDEARRRAAHRDNVAVVEADATTWQPPEAVDCVYFSYSLTMIPAWRSAIDNALAMLKPGGRLGVVDFYVSAPCPGPGMVHHRGLTRWFWRRWFGHQGVRLDPEHLAFLQQEVPAHCLTEHFGSVPCLPLLRVPYFVFTGTKAAQP